MSLGKPAWKEARSSLQRILSASEGVLRDNQDLQKSVLIPKSHILYNPELLADCCLTITKREHATSSPDWRLHRLLLFKAARHQCWYHVQRKGESAPTQLVWCSYLLVLMICSLFVRLHIPVGYHGRASSVVVSQYNTMSINKNL